MKNSDLVYFAKTNNLAIIPNKRDEDAGYDVYACFDENSILLEPGDIKLVPTGISTAFSKDRVLFVKERSSTGKIGLAVRMGVIDSGYRGEIKIGLNNTNKIPIRLDRDAKEIILNSDLIIYPYNKAIAQLVFCLIPACEVIEVDRSTLLELTSERQESFLGASGK